VRGVDYHFAMDAPRLTVALTIDHDAISDSIRRGDSPVKFSHAEFGPRVGAKRILELLASRAIPATWFVPGHTLTTFTDDTDAILAGGHELACHGWFHEDFAELGLDQTRDVLGRSLEAVRAVTGAAPAGFRAPYWSLGTQTLDRLRTITSRRLLEVRVSVDDVDGTAERA